MGRFLTCVEPPSEGGDGVADAAGAEEASGAGSLVRMIEGPGGGEGVTASVVATASSCALGAPKAGALDAGVATGAASCCLAHP